MISKKAVVIHSGGMDSSLCLALAMREFGREHVLSLSFNYHQRHSTELIQAAKICREWQVDHAVVDIGCLKELTEDALSHPELQIEMNDHNQANTLVMGRNGLMAQLGAIHAKHLGACCIWMGVMELEGVEAGYRDCSQNYIDLKQHILRLDLDDPSFEIRTPLIKFNKKQTIELAHQLGILDFLLKETVTCYNGKTQQGCGACPSCFLRNRGIDLFLKEHPHYVLPWA